MILLREWIHRLLGTVRRGRRDRDMEEELRLHLELEIEDARRRGGTPEIAARRARLRAGGVVQTMDAMRDRRGWPGLHALSSDLVFAWRQLNKHRSTSAAAILSLALAVGATTAAFRLVNAVLFRTLPVVEPDRLFALGWNAVTPQGDTQYRDEFDYHTFRRYTEVVGQNATLMIVGMAGSPQTIAFNESDEPERITRQFVSGNVFPVFGLQPAIGRLLTRSDDVTPGGHPVAVISYDYWTRRFGRAPGALGQTFRSGGQSYDIIGVAPRGFTGTEPGRVTDLFIPAAMNVEAIGRPGWSWFRIWLKPATGVEPEQARQLLQAEFMSEHQERVTKMPADTPRAAIDNYLREELRLVASGAGASGLQRNLRRPLTLLFALVVLVLLIACANVANLLSAQAAARTREMALRMSIGAGRWRLIQLVLVESVVLAICASAAGAAFAWWAAPFVISLVDIGEPLHLILDADWRTVAFGLVLTMIVAVLFGLAPALRASAVRPVRALKGDDPHANRRLARTLIGAQMTFCVFVLFVAGLLVATFANLSRRPLGFEYDRVLLVNAQQIGAPGSPILDQLMEQFRGLPGVEAVALANWVPLSQNRWSAAVRVDGQLVAPNPALMLAVSPALFDTLRIGLVSGRDFRAGDAPPRIDQARQAVAGVGIVNEAFARVYFNGESPVGRTVTVAMGGKSPPGMEIVGMVNDAAYYSVRETVSPTVYLPPGESDHGTIVIRTAGDPLSVVPDIRRDLARVRGEVRAASIRPYREVIDRQLVFERLLAILSSFFAVVALLLSGIGLFGVLNYAVIRQRREIGVRMALGARAAQVVRRVTSEMLSPVGLGAVVGLGAGLGFGRVIESLLFEVKTTDASTIATPLVMLSVAAILAALPPTMRAVRIDPAQTLRNE
jgi:predicted permease